MTATSLRAYNRDIEAMIDRGQNDDAVTHCKYILKYFPKHVGTYRLLGKAFLESHHYSEAADILRRVLSVIPDDFYFAYWNEHYPGRRRKPGRGHLAHGTCF